MFLASCLGQRNPNILREVPNQYQRMLDATVYIESLFSLGSGFAVSKDTIMTAWHVVDDGVTSIKTRWDETCKVESIKQIKDIDAAILKVSGCKLRPAQHISLAKTGSAAIVVGHPFGLKWALSKGVVSSKAKEYGDRKLFQIDASCNPGNSGGPVFAMDGSVMGIVVSIYTVAGGFDGICFAVPMSEVKIADYQQHHDESHTLDVAS